MQRSPYPFFIWSYFNQLPGQENRSAEKTERERELERGNGVVYLKGDEISAAVF